MKENHNILLSTLGKNDTAILKELIQLFHEVFETSPTVATDQHLQRLLSTSGFIAIVAMKDGKVLGGLTAYELAGYYSEKSELYIYDIAVQTAWHNQGIGKSLIEYLKRYAKEKEIETIFVEAHTEDVQAVKFYESTFGMSEKVEHFNFEVQ